MHSSSEAFATDQVCPVLVMWRWLVANGCMDDGCAILQKEGHMGLPSLLTLGMSSARGMYGSVSVASPPWASPGKEGGQGNKTTMLAAQMNWTSRNPIGCISAIQANASVALPQATPDPAHKRSCSRACPCSPRPPRGTRHTHTSPHALRTRSLGCVWLYYTPAGACACVA